MDFSKKLKLRLCLAVLYILLGITSIIVYTFNLGEDTVLLTFGTAFTAMGVLRVIRYFKDNAQSRIRPPAENRGVG